MNKSFGKLNKMISFQNATTNNFKIFPKRSLNIECDFTDLRDTGATLTPTPKNKIKREICASDFEFIRFLGNGKFGSVYLARYNPYYIGTSIQVSFLQ
jgi:hypothetical protein